MQQATVGTSTLRRAAGLYAIVAIAGLLAACDNGNGGPTQPTTPTPGDLLRGQAGLTIVAPFDDKCTARTPAWGLQPPMILAQGLISADGAGWVFRLGNTFGNFQINLTSGGMTQTDLTLTGAAQGTATDMLSLLRFQDPDRVAVSGAGGPTATMEGTFSTQLRGVNGRMSGTFVFTDNRGGVMTCSESLVFLFLLNR
jgi:hypothetical protein